MYNCRWLQEGQKKCVDSVLQRRRSTHNVVTMPRNAKTAIVLGQITLHSEQFNNFDIVLSRILTTRRRELPFLETDDVHIIGFATKDFISFQETFEE
jgi:hypothetical protein